MINTFGMSWEEDPFMGVYYDVGDTIELRLPDGTKKNYEVMALASVPYAMTSRRFSLFDTRVILPETEYFSNVKDKGAMLTMLSVGEKKETAVNQALETYTENEEKNLTCVSKQTYEKEFQEFTSMFWIVGGALSFVLALIGILNFINAIVTGILSRKKELAMMEAVGMTGKQMKVMLACVIPVAAYNSMAKESTVERIREND